MEKAKMRYGLLDSLRGLTILQMILFHFFYDLRYLTDVPMDWYQGRWVFYWQQGILWSFVILSGISWNLGRHHWRRGATVLALGFVITGGTLVLMPQEKILFGVLTFLGTAMLLLIPLDCILRKAPPQAGIFVSLLLFFFTKNLSRGCLGFFRIPILQIPESLPRGWFSTFLGLPFPGFYSSDYVPLFPAFFLYLTGYYLWKVLKKSRGAERLLKKEVSWLSWLGRRSLWIYMLHQPAAYALALGLDCLI